MSRYQPEENRRADDEANSASQDTFPGPSLEAISRKSSENLQTGYSSGSSMARPSAAQARNKPPYAADDGRKIQMRTPITCIGLKATDIGAGSIWLIVALYFVLTSVYVPA
jgi:hypothetical protein